MNDDAFGMDATTTVEISDGGDSADDETEGGLAGVATLGPYPGTEADSSFQSGSVIVTEDASGALVLAYQWVGETGGASGGIHVHTGRTCDDASQVGGHYWTPQTMADMWIPAKWQSSSGKVTVAGTGLSLGDVLGRTVVVHAPSGSRWACGVITYSVPAYVPAEKPEFAPTPKPTAEPTAAPAPEEPAAESKRVISAPEKEQVPEFEASFATTGAAINLAPTQNLVQPKHPNQFGAPPKAPEAEGWTDGEIAVTILLALLLVLVLGLTWYCFVKRAKDLKAAQDSIA